jgi:hypothetical protein
VVEVVGALWEASSTQSHLVDHGAAVVVVDPLAVHLEALVGQQTNSSRGQPGEASYALLHDSGARPRILRQLTSDPIYQALPAEGPSVQPMRLARHLTVVKSFAMARAGCPGCRSASSRCPPGPTAR